MVRAPVDPDGAASRALRSAGLRMTMPRQAMLAWLAEHLHCTADVIGAGLRERFRSVSAQAVYDVLAACATAGLLRRIEPAGHPARYERRTGDSHHHVVCRRFDRTEDPGCVIGAEPCLASARDMGFVVDEAEVVSWGVFPASSAAEDPADGARHDEEVRQ